MHKHPLVECVDAGQKAVVFTKNVPPSIQYIRLSTKPNILLQLKMHDGAFISVETRKLMEVSQDLSIMAKLFEIFQANYPWQGRLKAADLDKYFIETLFVNPEYTIIDLIKKNNEIQGFNVAELVPAKQNHRSLLIHHILLAVAHKSITNYRRLMTLISFLRAFQTSPETLPILTVYEAASLPSYLQSASMNCYRYKEADKKQWENLLVKTIYKEAAQNGELVKENDHLYMKDPITHFAPNPANWSTPTSLAAERFYKNDVKPGYSVITFFKNSSDNCKKFKDMINPQIKDQNISCLLSSKAKL